MKTPSCLICGLLIIPLSIYLAFRWSVPDEKSKIMAKYHWDGSFKKIYSDNHPVRLPLSQELAKSLGELGIQVGTMYDSNKVGLIVIPQGKSTSDLQQLISQCEASSDEINEEHRKWWEKNKERLNKLEEAVATQPEVIEAQIKFKKRKAELESTSMENQTPEEIFLLRYDALKEYDEIAMKYRKLLSQSSETKLDKK